MSNEFDLISEVFLENTESLLVLLETFETSTPRPRVRIAVAQSSILLLASQFEETIRQLAKARGRRFISGLSGPRDFPSGLPESIWKKSLESLARKKIGRNGQYESLSVAIEQSRETFEQVCRFLDGDLGVDVFEHLVHNEGNMTYQEINNIFKLLGPKGICKMPSEHPEMKEFFGEDDANKVDGRFLSALNSFFELRNDVAHSLNTTSSVGYETIRTNIEMMRVFIATLAQVLQRS